MADVGLILSRLCHYVAVTVLLGGVLFPLYAGAGHEGAPLRRLRIGAAALTLVTALAWFAFTTASMAGDPAALAEPPVLASVVTTTAFGRLWMVRLVLAALMIGLVLPRSAGTPLRAASALVAGALIASLAATGHGPSPAGAAGWTHLAADGLHLLAAGAWLGAFPPLLMLVFGPLETIPAVARAHGALDALSRIGPAVVALIVLSGLVNGWYLIGPNHLADLATTPWGAALLVKLALFAGMLALAGAHRWRLVPALAETGGGPNTVRVLRRTLALEAALGLAVLGVVSLLGTLQPPGALTPS
jgi:putative copper resistance protein D